MAILCAIVMVIGFLVSRAALSISMMVLGGYLLLAVHPKEWLKQKWWWTGVAWLAFLAISWFWSEDKSYWGKRIEVKLPILLLPLAFAFLPAFSKKQIRIYTAIVAVILLGSIVYSIQYFINRPDFYTEQYGISKVLPTLVKNDHIRYSSFLVMFVVWCFSCWPYFTKALKWLLGIAISLIVVYLHFLAAKTGLLMLYVFLITFLGYVFFTKSKVLGLSVLAVLTFAIIGAYKYVPTFHSKVHYVLYSYQQFKEGDRTGNYSDIGRLVSYDVSGKVIKNNVLLGVGAGDVLDEMGQQYQLSYPDIPEGQQLVPHNQFLIIAVATGLLGLILFSIWVFYPFFEKSSNRRSHFFLRTTWLVLLIPLMTDPTLEIQFGIFVYLFSLLWQRHVTLHEPV